ncbi:probable receptor-like protein kinase At5g24010 [Aristolochia californica]|uniref:probable receptor-like protein kinase At5g24010 n=1 Tax=Aristolochia californica TaxID=171875 RepID=UPI0035DEADC7
MGMLQRQTIRNLYLSIFLQFFLLWNASSAFVPSDNNLINCGSEDVVTLENRLFVPDAPADSFRLSAASSVSLKDGNPVADSSPLYHTARIFTKRSMYEFSLKIRGTHFVRLHFYPFSSQGYNLSAAVFSVSAQGFLLLKDFAVPNGEPIVKEFLINVRTENFDLSFGPSYENSSLAFVNAIEVFSAPGDLILDVARGLGANQLEVFDGLSRQGLETVYRLNVGGPKVTPFNDSLWRTWTPDEKYLRLPASAKAVSFSGRIRYQKGGASREVAPDSVYRTAREMNSVNISEGNFNITWVLPVSLGYKYLVRMHFCDIVSLTANELFFNIYINGYLGCKDFDLSAVDVTNQMLAAPFYMDFVVEPASSGDIHVTIGPSRLSSSSKINAILNGLEIMKMNNSLRSFDGEVSADSVLRGWPRSSTVFWLCSFLGGCALMSALLVGFLMVSKRRLEMRESVAWSPLPVDPKEDNSRYGPSPLSGKLVYY